MYDKYLPIWTLAIHFIQAHFYEPYHFLGDIRLIENVIQDLPPESYVFLKFINS